MKCPRCLTVCTSDDSRCPGCGALFIEDLGALPPVGRERRAARWALVALAIGAGLGPLVGDSIPLIPKTPSGPDVNLIVWACLGGGIGAVIGYFVALARFNTQQPVRVRP